MGKLAKKDESKGDIDFVKAILSYMYMNFLTSVLLEPNVHPVKNSLQLLSQISPGEKLLDVTCCILQLYVTSTEFKIFMMMHLRNWYCFALSKLMMCFN